MSAIDGYKHQCLGIIWCPSHYPIVYLNEAQRNVPIYRLEEDVDPQERSFQGKRGDILIGGGSGESAALRISLPEAFNYYTYEAWEGSSDSATWTPTTISKAYWRMTEAYVFGDGYLSVGWKPPKDIEVWLTEHMLSFLVQRYAAEYGPLLGPLPLEEDGSICRLPTDNEMKL